MHAMPSTDRAISLPVVTKRSPVKSPVHRTKASRWRWTVLWLVQLAMVLHVVHWLVTGSTVTPIEPSESMAFVSDGVINAGAIFFGIALLSTLIFGRFFCGWACHVILLQDLCSALLRRLGIRPKPFRSRLLLYVPFILALWMFVWPLVFRFGIAPIASSLHRTYAWIPDWGNRIGQWQARPELETTEFWSTFPTLVIAIPFLFVCGFAVVYLLGNKGFCTYGCPYGGFFAPIDQYSPFRIRVNEDCDETGHCTAACTSNVRVHAEVAQYGMVVDPGCMKCLDCISVCPNDALSLGFGRTAVQKTERKPARRAPSFDFTVAEEIALALIFFLSFMAFRGPFQVIPMLMGVGMALCTTYLAWKLVEMWRRPSVNLHRFRLKYKGRVTRAGRLIGTLTILGLAITAHAGVMSVMGWRADRADGEVMMRREAVFNTNPVVAGGPMAEAARRALTWYERRNVIWRGGWALHAPPRLDTRRAWLHACLGEFEEAEALLRGSIERYGVSDLMVRDIMILMQIQLRDDEALAYAAEMIERKPGLITTVDALARARALEGNHAAGIELLERERARLEASGEATPAATLFLLRAHSLFEILHGDLEHGIELVLETIEIDDTNPASYVVLAEAYRSMGRDTEALDAVGTAYDKGVRSPQLLTVFAELLEQVGQTQRAQELRREADALQMQHTH